MDKEVIKVNFSIGQGTDWLKINLEDFVYSLNKNLTKTKEGEVSGELKGGVFTATIRNSTIDVIKPYVDAFVRAMKKNGSNFILNIREEDPPVGEISQPGEVKGNTVNRGNLFTKVILLDCSLEDATRNE
jgi:hypothetical protein